MTEHDRRVASEDADCFDALRQSGPMKRHAQFHFPPLSGKDALLVANFFDSAIAAIWRTHGDAMREQLCRYDDEPLPERDLDDIF